MVLTKKRFWETFKVGMNEAFESAKRYHKISFKSGEPQKKLKISKQIISINEDLFITR